jgi:hypothetical protein
MKTPTTGTPGLRRFAFTVAGLLLLLAFSDAAYGQEVSVRNTAKQIRPGLYECVLYVEASPKVYGSIGGVTYTLPPGFVNRKQRKETYPYRSDPFHVSASEEVVVNVRIEYKGGQDAYFNYKLTFDRKR